MNIKNAQSEATILLELEKLCNSCGYAHALASICLESSFIPIDALNNYEKRLSLHKKTLMQKEAEILIGFMIKGNLNNALKVIPEKDINAYIKKSKKLLLKLQKFTTGEIDESLSKKPDNENIITQSHHVKKIFMEKVLRDNFFYGAESTYDLQYRELSQKRYENDDEWLILNKGFTSKDAKKIITLIERIIKTKLHMNLLYLFFGKSDNYSKEFEHYADKIKNFTDFKNITLPDFRDIEYPAFFVFLIEKKLLLKASKISPNVIECFLNAFSIKSTPCNKEFKGYGDFNEISAYPLIKIDDEHYILFQPRLLLKSFYRSPYFWMLESNYKEQANQNKGKFVEEISAKFLKKVFDEKHIYKNVSIRTPSSRDEVGEIDILIIYAGRAIVAQVKAKNMTLKAIKGDTEAIKDDFRKAVQDAYNQCFDCSILLLNEDYILLDKDGNKLNIKRNFIEIFTMCITGDSYPASDRQASLMLKVKEHDIIHKPYITDIFVLDVLCEFLDTPIHFLNFQRKRMQYFEQIYHDNEVSVLGYYLTYNFFIKENMMLHIDDILCSKIDEPFLSRRNEVKAVKTPEGILTKFKNTYLNNIMKQLNDNEKDVNIELAYFLIDLNEEDIIKLSDAFKGIIKKTKKDKSLHDFMFIHEDSAIIAYASYAPDSEAFEKLMIHCKIRKYDQKLTSFFGILLNIDSKRLPLKKILYLNSPWEKSDKIDKALQKISLTKIIRKN